ncbi:hypothetical protein CK203_091210 [Vitis vinifera]|uniref:Reverse transcriptase domain-containing protein n=1 Tax=Vitis vinifera TaxID=29760 RepID=A0A438EMH2_VITVI|nr:hypothetical protein CK203_091210 [Vitis vinifera]
MKAKEGGFINGFQVRGREGEGVEISHLLFADDTLNFCDARKEVLEYLSWIRMWFEAMSSLKINLEKSELIPIGEVSNLEDLVRALGCKEGSLPSMWKVNPGEEHFVQSGDLLYVSLCHSKESSR